MQYLLFFVRFLWKLLQLVMTYQQECGKMN